MKKIIDFLVKEVKIKNNDIIVIANSGGPDSMFLFNVLLSMREKYSLKIICAHVNHNVREESASEKEFLMNYCNERNVIFESMTIEKYGDDNFHNEARKIRYNFFEDVVKKYGANYLMTAHHGDDLMETILMRIVRGSTLKGYSGFEKVSKHNGYLLVRPLVYMTKEEIKQYDDERGIPYVTDKSNFKGKYTRNRYRMKVLPFLKDEDPKVHEKFLKFSEILEEYDSFINGEILKNIKNVYKDDVIDIKYYLTLDKLIRRKIICYILEDIYKDELTVINDKHVNALMKLLESKRANCKICLPRGCYVEKNYGSAHILKRIDCVSNYELELDKFALLPNGMKLEMVKEEESNNNYVCRIDSSEVQLPLYVRCRKTGDKMLLKKVDGYKKIKDIFIDCKVPIKKRDEWPVVVDSKGTIIWLPGLKKSKFTRLKNEKYDIIIKCN